MLATLRAGNSPCPARRYDLFRNAGSGRAAAAISAGSASPPWQVAGFRSHRMPLRFRFRTFAACLAVARDRGSFRIASRSGMGGNFRVRGRRADGRLDLRSSRSHRVISASSAFVVAWAVVSSSAAA